MLKLTGTVESSVGGYMKVCSLVFSGQTLHFDVENVFFSKMILLCGLRFNLDFLAKIITQLSKVVF